MNCPSMWLDGLAVAAGGCAEAAGPSAGLRNEAAAALHLCADLPEDAGRWLSHEILERDVPPEMGGEHGRNSLNIRNPPCAGNLDGAHGRKASLGRELIARHTGLVAKTADIDPDERPHMTYS